MHLFNEPRQAALEVGVERIFAGLLGCVQEVRASDRRKPAVLVIGEAQSHFRGGGRDLQETVQIHDGPLVAVEIPVAGGTPQGRKVCVEVA